MSYDKYGHTDLDNELQNLAVRLLTVVGVSLLLVMGLVVFGM